MLKIVIAAVSILFALHAQEPRFEVASIKLAVFSPPRPGVTGRSGGAGGGCPQSLKVDPSQLSIRCGNLAMLIGYAFRSSPERISGPDWLREARSQLFDIVAKLPEGAREQQTPEMMQALLQERFGLALHRGTAIREVYALVAAKGGVHMNESSDPPTDANPPADASLGFFGPIQISGVNISSPRMGTVHQSEEKDLLERWEAPGISLEGLAELLDMAMPISTPVVEATGIRGRFAMTLEVSMKEIASAPDRSPENLEERSVAAFNDGLRKLGLELERRKAPIAILIIDHLEKLPTQN